MGGLLIGLGCRNYGLRRTFADGLGRNGRLHGGGRRCDVWGNRDGASSHGGHGPVRDEHERFHVSDGHERFHVSDGHERFHVVHRPRAHWKWNGTGHG
jgi:hypothetical protein